MIKISNKEFIDSLVGVITRMSPHYQPRNIDAIIDYCIIKINEDNRWVSLKKNPDKYDLAILSLDSDNNLYPLIKELLMGCEEFTQLNISKREWDEGLRNPDENVNHFVFSGRGIPEIKWEYDFIDLDACIRNIVNELFILYDANTNCFLCKYASKNNPLESSECEECKYCICNEKLQLRNNYIFHSNN